MFIPQKFKETNPAIIKNLINKYSFATLISNHDGNIEVTHLPLLFNENDGQHGSLEGHFAKANPQWRSISGQNVLAIFQGPHHYISPTWYKKDDVPTWNYLSVHVYGELSFIEDEAYIMEHLQEMVQKYEGTTEKSWSMSGLDQSYISKLSKGLVAFKIDIQKIQSKAKLGQNRSREDMQGYIEALKNIQSDQSMGLAEFAEDKMLQKFSEES